MTIPDFTSGCFLTGEKLLSRVRLSVALALAFLLGACAHVGDRHQASELRVMTYNIRLDLASDGPNSWSHRKAMVAALIQHEAPAILGMQEVLSHQRSDLQAALPDFTIVGVARDDGRDKGEFSPLAFRRDRFAMLQSGTFWLSLTPAQPGKGWDAAYPRIAAWALLRDTRSGTHLAVLNTHFDHVGTAARLNSAVMIAAWTRARIAEGSKVIVLGDFNAAPSSAPIQHLANSAHSGLRLAQSLSATRPYGPPGTFNAFKIEAGAPEPIDHIFVSDGIAVLRHSTITQHWGGRLPSDHYPVTADLLIKR